MPTTLQHPTLSAAEAFERIFLQTVLRMRGVTGSPTPLQYTEARYVLDLYRSRVALARERDLADDSDWLTGCMQEQMAVERAFLFVRFGSVMRKTESQNLALHSWLRACRAP